MKTLKTVKLGVPMSETDKEIFDSLEKFCEMAKDRDREPLSISLENCRPTRPLWMLSYDINRLIPKFKEIGIDLKIAESWYPSY